MVGVFTAKKIQHLVLWFLGFYGGRDDGCGRGCPSERINMKWHKYDNGNWFSGEWEIERYMDGWQLKNKGKKVTNFLTIKYAKKVAGLLEEKAKVKSD